MFFDQQQTVVHDMGGFETALVESRYNRQHDSILLNIYKAIKSHGLQAIVDREGYPNPSVVTGDEQRLDFAIFNYC